MVKGIIFDYKGYAIHDGPGIRTTVFFKGCSLSCPWCHNPEGVEREVEVMFRPDRCREECRECLSACPSGAISKRKGKVEVDPEQCDLCEKCRDACVYEAFELVGQEQTVAEVVARIEKDSVFYEESDGGATLSGGEPLLQPEFLESLLDALRARSFHTTLDTSGYAPPEVLERIADKTDLFLYDLKLMDEKKHRQFTGVSNRLIHENLRRLSREKKRIIARMPLIAGINDDLENINKTTEYLVSLGTIKEVSLLPYHKGGCDKFRRLRKKSRARNFSPPPEERIEEITKTLAGCGLTVKIGG